jgi:hypothetical protein
MSHPPSLSPRPSTAHMLIIPFVAASKLKLHLTNMVHAKRAEAGPQVEE